MKIVFMGTPEFAVPCLEELAKSYQIQAVFTQPDRRKGRGKKMAMSAVKESALSLDIPVYQPEKIKKSEEVNLLRDLAPDVIVVVAYGQLLSQEILDIPKLGCINVHASLLPKYRGAAPANFAILRGEKESGVTTQYMVKKLDAGDVIDKLTVDIPIDMTAGGLLDELSSKGSELILKTLKDIENGIINRTPQIDEESTYAPLMDKEMALVKWENSSFDVHNLIRAFNPWPIATTTLNGEKMKLYITEMVDEKSAGLPGQIAEVNADGILVNCGDKKLLIKEMQMPNKKRMTVSQYILGHTIDIGTILGE